MITDQTEIALADTPASAVPAELKTAEPHRGGVLQRIFSFPVTIAALLIVVTVFTVGGRFSDPDMWWHLKTGEFIWTTHAIPRVDPFSFTAAGHPWIAQEWLSQLTIYGAYKLGGYSGMMVWLCILASLVVVAGYALCWLYSENGKIAFLGAMGIWYFATIGFSLRPQLLGYLFLLGELLILQLGRTRGGRWFFALPPLFALWINCHSSFMFGLVVLTVVLFCSFLDFRARLLISSSCRKQTRNTLVACFALSLAALFANPVGPKLIWYPLDVMFHQRLNLAIVAEWQPPLFDDSRTWALFGLAALLLLVPLVRHVELKAEELILAALGFGLAVQHERMLFVFGILTAPVLCRLVSDTWDRYEPGRELVVSNALLIVAAAVMIGVGFPSAGNLAEQVNKGNPVNALKFIEHSGFSGRMLNDYPYGGYLMWAAPKRKVFVDGRADLYEPAGVLADYAKWATIKADPRFLPNKYHIDYCVLERESPIARVMQLLPDWKSVYSDDMSVVFVRSAPSVGIKPNSRRLGS